MMTEFQALGKEYAEKLADLKRRLKMLLETLPDAAPGVELMPGSLKCGIVSFKTLSENKGILSPRYYLTAGVKQTLLDIVDRTPLEELDKKIRGIIETGSLPTTSAEWRPKLHPAFVADLQMIWTGDGIAWG